MNGDLSISGMLLKTGERARTPIAVPNMGGATWACALREDRLRMKLLHSSIKFERLERVFALFDGNRKFALRGVAVLAAKDIDLGFDGARGGG
jgi:hypothetical protein